MTHVDVCIMVRRMRSWIWRVRVLIRQVMGEVWLGVKARARARARAGGMVMMELWGGALR